MLSERKSKILNDGISRPKVFLTLSLIFAVVVGLASYFKDDGIRSLIDRDQRLTSKRELAEKLEADNRALRRRVKSIHDDSYLVEKFAREKLQLVKENEIVFRFYDNASYNR